MWKRRQPSAFDVLGVTARRRRERFERFGIPLVVLSVSSILGAAVGIAPAVIPSTSPTTVAVSAISYDEPLSGCTVTDGDTVRCNGERIRLLAIDAPELPGHCRAGRDCAPGDPFASTSSLEAALVGNLTINRVGKDRYGRTLARVAGNKGDLSCWQLERRKAVYKAKWDNGLRIARTCPGSIL